MRTRIKIATTLNGSTFDTPSSISINRSSDIPSCKLTFPRRIGSRYRARKNDVFRVYVGIGGAPDTVNDMPVFTGFMESERGFDLTELELYGILSRAMKEYIIIDDNTNFDGNEVSTAILSVLKSISSLQRPGFIESKFLIEKTDPVLTVPKDTRADRGISKWEVIKQFADMTKDERNMMIRNFVLFEMGDNIYFRKEPDPVNSTPHIYVSYGSSLIDFEEDGKGTESINKIKVIGKDGINATYQNDHRIAVDGLREGEPVNDNTITSAGECSDIARLLVQSRLFDNYGLTMQSQNLLYAVPGCSLIQVDNAPYGMNGKYIMRGSSIDISSESIGISATVSKYQESLGDVLSKVLRLDSVIYPTGPR